MELTTTGDIVVRLAEPGDAAELQARCLTMATVEAVREEIEENGRGYAAGERIPLVALVDGAVVGMAVFIRDSHILRRHRGGLFSLVTSEAYQGRGIARRLVEEICRRVPAFGIEILETSCRAATPAEQVYPRLGFTEYGRLPRGLQEPWGGQNVFDEVYFYMPLSGDTA